MMNAGALVIAAVVLFATSCVESPRDAPERCLIGCRDVVQDGVDSVEDPLAISACNSDVSECQDPNTAIVCRPDGGWMPLGCAQTETCLDGACLPGRCVPQILLVVDRSGSMYESWDAVEQAFTAVLESTDGVAFGLLAFPIGTGCSIYEADGILPRPEWPDVPLGTGAEQLLEVFVERSPTDAGWVNSPVVRTLEWISENPEAVWQPSLGPRFVVILTDGEDSCRCPGTDTQSCLAAGLTQAVVKLQGDQDVTTIAIGFRHAGRRISPLLDVIAVNGGSDFTEHIPAGNAGELGAAILNVVESAKECGL